MRRSLLAVPLVALALGLAACGDDDDEAAVAEESAPETTTGEAVAAEGQDPPLVGGFYDDEPVDYLLTDVSTVIFVASLGEVPESSTAKLYLFMNGVEGANPFGFQANVIDSVPGEREYSPLWDVQAVTWADESQARELRSEEEIVDAESAGELEIEDTDLIKNSPVVP